MKMNKGELEDSRRKAREASSLVAKYRELNARRDLRSYLPEEGYALAAWANWRSACDDHNGYRLQASFDRGYREGAKAVAWYVALPIGLALGAVLGWPL